MIYLAQQFWWAIAVAAALGLLFEAVAGPGRATLSSRRITRLVALAIIPLGALVSGLGLVPGRPGLWLDAAVLILAGYGVGCLLGSALRAVIQGGREEPAPDTPAEPAG